MSASSEPASEPVTRPKAGEHHTCISTYKHAPENIRDHTLHYIACIEIEERATYFDNDVIWNHEREIERARIKRKNGWPENDEELSTEQKRTVDEAVKKSIGEAICSTALVIDRELKRIEMLRQAMDREEETERNPNWGKRLIASRKEWKKTPEYKTNISKVRHWRLDQRSIQQGIPSLSADDATQEQALALPSTGTIELESRIPADRLRALFNKHMPSDSQMHKQLENHIAANSNEYSLLRDFKAYVIEYKYAELQRPVVITGRAARGSPKARTWPTLSPNDRAEKLYYLEPHTEKESAVFRGSFPSQKVNLEDLLEQPEVVQAQDGRVRYIHIPSNNMDWVEQVIAKYYNEKRPNFERIHRAKEPATKSYMILRPEYWRGQQHGGATTPVHSRHMRPLCETVSSDQNRNEDVPRNLTLFMPYLHWETNRRRELMAEIIFAATQENLKNRQKQQRKDRDRLRELRRGLPGRSLPKITHPSKEATATKRRKIGGPMDTMPSVVNAAAPTGPRLKITNKLARVFMDAAKLYEAMSLFRDEQMVQTYLCNDPPLHPRRTLDQSYYWTLRSTEARDRDQVVFRHTNIKLEGSHKFRAEKKPQAYEHIFRQFFKAKNRAWKGRACKREEDDPCRCRGGGACTCMPVREDHCCADCMKGWQWTDHDADHDRDGCENCRNNARKMTRAIMVDQLWMWILDENTILTCFPKRYGVNKPDPSGVHKSIRMRLKVTPKHDLRSAYDLALIILDECTSTFFDRTKARDKQPRLTDIFSESIGKIANKQTILFDHLWHWTNEASRIYRSKCENASTNSLHIPLLDINPEGKLQREIKDIIDELDMMIHVGIQQLKMLRRFNKLVQQMMDPDALYGEPGSNLDSEIAAIVRSSRTPSWNHADSPTAKVGEPGEPGRQASTYNSPANRAGQYKRFSDNAKDLIADVEDRISELETLKKSALSTAENVKELLALKQQQASVVQAYESVRQAEETVRQGRAIMMFTIVTIIFLPLSFMSSVFGMNAIEFSTENKVSLTTQVPIMIGVSGFVIVITLIVAFSSFVRAVMRGFVEYFFIHAMVSTGVYRLWLTWGHSTQSVDSMTHKEINNLKKRARKEKNEADDQARKKAEEAQKAEEAKKAAKTESGTSSASDTAVTRAVSNGFGDHPRRKPDEEERIDTPGSGNASHMEDTRE